MKKILPIIVALLAMTSTQAFANDVYVTFALSNSNVQVDNTINNDSPETEDRSTGATYGIGYDITPIIAIEFNYEHFGNAYLNGDSQEYNHHYYDSKTKFVARSASVWLVVDPTITKINGMPLKGIGRVGYARTRVNISETYSIGVDANDEAEVFVDYRIRNTALVDIDTVNIGLKINF